MSIVTASGRTAVPSLLDNLQAAWYFDEITGTRKDRIGSSHLTAYANPSRTTGTGNLTYACDFVTGSSQYFDCASNSTLQAGDIDYTIAAWIYLADKNADYDLVSRWKAAGANVEYRLYFDMLLDRFVFIVSSDGKIPVVGVGNPTVRVQSYTAPDPTTWYLILASHDASNDQLRIRMNNGTANTASYSSGIYTGNINFNIGRMQSTNYLNGRIAQVLIWKKILSSAEESELYNSGLGNLFPF